jgi:hypothetical protein
MTKYQRHVAPDQRKFKPKILSLKFIGKAVIFIVLDQVETQI